MESIFTESNRYIFILAAVVFIFFIWNNHRLKKERQNRKKRNFRERYNERKKQKEKQNS